MRGLVAIFTVGAISAIANFPTSTQVEGFDVRRLSFQNLLLPPAYGSPPQPPGSGGQIRPPMVRIDRSSEGMVGARPGASNAAALARGEGASRRPEAAVSAITPKNGAAPNPTAHMVLPASAGSSTTAVPDGQPQHGRLSRPLWQSWQVMGFVGGLIALAIALFWRLGRRARSSTRGLEPLHDVADEALPDEALVGARYATLHDAITAMKKGEAAKAISPDQ